MSAPVSISYDNALAVVLALPVLPGLSVAERGVLAVATALAADKPLGVTAAQLSQATGFAGTSRTVRLLAEKGFLFARKEGPRMMVSLNVIAVLKAAEAERSRPLGIIEQLHRKKLAADAEAAERLAAEAALAEVAEAAV